MTNHRPIASGWRWPAAVAFAVLVSVGLTACSEKEIHPDRLPYRLNEVTRYPHSILNVADFDGDGKDEFWRIVDGGEGNLPEGISAVLVHELASPLIQFTHQFNFPGSVVSVREPMMNDSQLAGVIVAYVRNDSLFAAILHRNAGSALLDRDVLHTIFVTRGEPRVEPDLTYPWDPRVPAVAIADVDRDGSTELVTVVSTEYAGLPRGVFVNDLETGRPVGQSVVGAKIGKTIIGDFDGDGHLDVAAGGFASDNGASAGGLTDRVAHFILFELRPEPEVAWSDSAGRPVSMIKPFYDRVLSSMRSDLFTVTTFSRPRDTRAELSIIDPRANEYVRKWPTGFDLKGGVLIDINRDGVKELVSVRFRDQEVVAFDAGLEMVARLSLPRAYSVIAEASDLNGDGPPEITVQLSGRGGAVLSSDLSPLAVTELDLAMSTVRRGVDAVSALLASEDQQTVVLELVPNPGYRWARLRPLILGSGTFLIIALVLVAGFVLARRMRVEAAYRDTAVETDSRGLALIASDGKVVQANARAEAYLDGYIEAETGRLSGALGRFVENAMRDEGPSDRVEFPFGSGSASASLVPLSERASRRSYWLMRVELAKAAGESGPDHPWSLMARRVAHDIKNPLTSILLNVRHLQKEIADRYPEAGPTVDRYTERVVDRIDYLRRNTNSFLKVIDATRPERVEADIDDFLERCLTPVRKSMPSDIELKMEVEKDLPAVAIDEDLMRSAVESLISNSINAMPEGGSVIVKAHHVEDIVAPSPATHPYRDVKRSYVVIEVLDTGIGMPRAVSDHVFEIGFTTSENGTGLGMAIVKKVMDDHDGYAVVESEKGSGTAVSLFIPTRDSAGAA